jgi:hypothetical protein
MLEFRRLGLSYLGGQKIGDKQLRPSNTHDAPQAQGMKRLRSLCCFQPQVALLPEQITTRSLKTIGCLISTLLHDGYSFCGNA